MGANSVRTGPEDVVGQDRGPRTGDTNAFGVCDTLGYCGDRLSK